MNATKVMAIIKYVFSLVGIGMLVGACFLYKSTSAFVAEATRAEGTVVELIRSESSSSATYKPVVNFVSQKGEKIEFVSSVSSNPPSYSKGQKVEILYLPAEPQNAEINGLFSIWGSSIILGGMSGVFFLIGAGIILVSMLNEQREEYLKEQGVRIETELQSVELHKAFSVNGRYPFRVVTQWQNPSTSKVHVFHSDDLWYDPTNYIKSKRITVFIEKNNPKKYFVDLSFLPKIAE